VAATELWGDAGVARIAERLTKETRQRTVDELLVLVDWVPVRYVMEWHAAAWEGPAARQEDTFARFVDRGVDNGFGRFRRTFLKLATPAQLVAQAPALWRYQHTHGDLSVVLRTDAGGTPRGAVATLRDNPMIESAISRRAVVEAWRHVLTLARVKEVRASHQLEGDALVARFSWARDEE
jgi:hypothetical protein